MDAAVPRRRVMTRRLSSGKGGSFNRGLLRSARVESLDRVRSGRVQQLPPLHIHPDRWGRMSPSFRCPLYHGLHRVALLQLLLSDRILSFHLHIQEGCHAMSIQPQRSADSERGRMRSEG